MDGFIVKKITKDELRNGFQILDYSCVLSVSEDGLIARLSPIHGELDPAYYPELIEFIKGKTPIVFGYLDNFQVDGSNWIIAKGEEPKKGEDSRIIFNKPKRRQDLPDNFVDLIKEKSLIVCYEKDEIIAEKLPNTPGIPGKNVFGEEIPAQPGKWIPFPVGQNVEICCEDRYLRATCSGKLEFIENKISIVDTYKLNSSVNHLTGNIYFIGKLLEINGNIEMGFSVDVQGDLIVNGYIQNATVNVTGNLMVKGVIYGEDCKIYVEKDITCNVIEQAHVVAKGSLIVKNYILDADCLAFENIILKEKKGMILGGCTTFGKTLIVNTIGSEQGTSTHIYGGLLNIKLEEYEKLKELYQINLKKLQQIKKGLDKINQIEKEEPLDDRVIIIKKRLTSGLIDIVTELKSIKEKMIQIEEQINTAPKPEIIVNKTVYPGVYITINNAHTEIKSEISRVRFKEEEGSIVNTKL